MQLLPPKKDFIQAKYDFIDEMLKFGQFPQSSAELAVGTPVTAMNTSGDNDNIADQPAPTIREVRILDVGCGIGGATRYVLRTMLTAVDGEQRASGRLMSRISCVPDISPRSSVTACVQPALPSPATRPAGLLRWRRSRAWRTWTSGSWTP